MKRKRHSEEKEIQKVSDDEIQIAIKVLSYYNNQDEIDSKPLRTELYSLFHKLKSPLPAKKIKKDYRKMAKDQNVKIRNKCLMRKFRMKMMENLIEDKSLPNQLEGTVDYQERDLDKQEEDCYPIVCYICKEKTAVLHKFYDQMCEKCGDFNYEKRFQTWDLSGRIALVTGGRIKIGFQVGLKLLRAGCQVICTTRFPSNAIERYQREKDYTDWKDRLHIIGIDFLDINSVVILCDKIKKSFPYLDIIINNACQTIKRPKEYYSHLEHKSTDILHLENKSTDILHLEDTSDGTVFFSKLKFDVHGNQIDLREKNSWVLKLEEVPTIEMAEVLVINCLAPEIINAKLRSHLVKSPNQNRFIVNVSAMEGQFYRKKLSTHPHTNMAKAALNMLTRTCASDYQKSSIYMTSVDTGWINDEHPAHIAKHHMEDLNFSPPLDEIDAASRILDPILNPLITDTQPPFGIFLKDYNETFW